MNVGADLGGYPPGTPLPSPKRRRNGQAVGVMLAVVAVGTVAGWIVVPEPMQGLVTVLALATAVTLAAAIVLPRWPERLAAILLLAFVATGTVLLFRSGTARAYGFIVLLLAFTILPWFAATVLAPMSAWARDRPSPPVPRPRTLALYLASGALIAATALGFAGIDAQVSGGYAVKHGQPVTVTLGQECTRFTDQAGVTTTTCSDARWTIDGETYQGTVHIGAGELDVELDIGSNTGTLYSFTNETIEAYAVRGDRDAFTAGFASRASDGLEVFYVVPWWLVLGAPVLILALIGAAIVRKLRRGRTQ